MQGTSRGFRKCGSYPYAVQEFPKECKCLLNGKDGHMFISHLETLRETKGLVFAYEIDADSALTRIFSTNADSIRCYALFGDAISFDPTYGTNKYNMKFAPFSGIDNQKKSITFGCVLLELEDDDSFIWAFPQFLKAMDGKEPNYIISDQDAGIINAVPDQQRQNLKLLEPQSHNSIPKTLFGSNWEAHAVKVYTHEVFFDFQEEVKLLVNVCSVCGYTPPDPVTNFEISIVEDANKRKRYAVEWSKNALRNPVYDLNVNLLENYDLTGNSKFGMSRVWSEIYATVDMLKRKEEESDMREFEKLINKFREKLEPDREPLTKEQELEVLLNCKAPNEIKILPPKVFKYKGSGKRLVSSKNKELAQNGQVVHQLEYKTLKVQVEIKDDHQVV
ncbi:uncharacterized protein LOC141641048 [Silene latifolia]|uniref:uncharacterized protein LOC141641048 n=1 Tax=Silene latifolia TaxID=37657 RepID=UPI003D76E189